MHPTHDIIVLFVNS